MKKYFYKNPLFHLIFILSISNYLTAQTSNNSIDATGDIAFTAYVTNATNSLSAFAFILLDNCPVNQSIGFVDDEWTGSSFAPISEGEIIWTNNTGATINKGTVIKIAASAINTAWPSASVNIGSIAITGAFTTGNGDQIFAMTGNRSSQGTFLAFVGGITTSTLCFQGTPFGSGCGSFSTNNLIFNGQYATNVTAGSAYTGMAVCNGTIAQCNTMINTAASWGSVGTFANAAAFFANSPVPNSFTGSVLPIELTRFEGKNQGAYNLLTWQTASESQNKGFDIERSSLNPSKGGEFTWRKIGFVAGNGTTNTRKEYSFEDNTTFSSPSGRSGGAVYYRLKQLDFDGRFEYSKIISIDSKGENVVSVFPNPSTGLFTITGIEDTEDETFTLINSIGQTLSITVQNDGQLDMSSFPLGVYYLRVASSGQVMKLVKE